MIKKIRQMSEVDVEKRVTKKEEDKDKSEEKEAIGRKKRERKNW